ncbi:MAG: D-alanyl-D-alanine carboxypeptidase/D-alanyl-D-alanine endopeptidase [Candidatus Nitrospinota bacterium M3_3B_026]
MGLRLAAFFVVFSSLAGPAAASANTLEKAARALFSQGCVNAEKTAVRVVDARSGAVIFDRNGATPLIPASVMKLFTTAAALEYLGPAYRFKTEIFHTGAIRDGVIEGDIMIRGGGDPKLTPEALWRIARDVGDMGVSRVEGALVADDSFFDGRKLAPGWSRRRTQRAYDAGLGALSVNFNTVAVKVYPGRREGAPLTAAVEPETPYVTIVNKGKTAGQGKPVSARRAPSGGRVKIVVTGVMSPGADGEVIYVNIADPARFAAETFRAALEREGIRVDGGVRIGQAPEGARLLYTHKSKPLAAILRELNHYSSNFVAEQIVKTIAATVNGEPGEHGAALDMTRKFAEKLGVDTGLLVFADGSGLSRENRLTARAVTDLLGAVAGRFDTGPDFIASLGIMGVDGSVKERVENSPARALARAKTGTLAGVSSLAGYVAGREGGLYAFAIIQNDNSCYYEKADKLEDDIVTAIHLMDGGG